MSTKRRIINRGKPGRITPEIVDAWKRADFHALHMLLRLRPWNASPLPKEIAGPLGCSLDDLPIDLDDPNRDEALPRVVAIQQELLRIVGWPDCRHVYEENLADAENGLRGVASALSICPPANTAPVLISRAAART